MTAIEFSPDGLADLERLSDFLISDDPFSAGQTAELVSQAIKVLHHHPLIGRPAESGLRELVILRGRNGYLALYRYDEVPDRVTILSLRHQREAGYGSP